MDILSSLCDGAATEVWEIHRGGGMAVLSAYLCSKYGEDELTRVEGVENISDNVEVGGGWNVWLKADIAELLLWSDVDGDILAKTIVITILASMW